ncbi:hypothetical protein cypCar_00021474 [Cyprinus carpio]|nr:hypothetical protein cypCar_00021474 [Cyprinus carpio]
MTLSSRRVSPRRTWSSSGTGSAHRTRRPWSRTGERAETGGLRSTGSTSIASLSAAMTGTSALTTSDHDSDREPDPKRCLSDHC